MRALIIRVFILSIFCFTTQPSLYAEVKELRYDPWVSGPITIGSALTFGTFVFFEDDIASKKCRWCDRRADGSSTLNGFDSSIQKKLVWTNKKSAGHLSHLSGFVILPLFSAGSFWLISGHESRWKNFWIDLGIVAEAAVTASLVGQIVQFAVARERPDSHDLSKAQSAALPASKNTSFYSGHTTFAFAVATSTATVATLRNYPVAPYLWAGGMALAGTTAYFRIAANRHYMTDVLAGAVMGSAIGFSMPYFLHRKDKPFSWTFAPTSDGWMTMAQWKW